MYAFRGGHSASRWGERYPVSHLVAASALCVMSTTDILPLQGTLYYDYLRALPVGTPIEMDFTGHEASAADGADDLDGDIVEFVLEKAADDNFAGLPFVNPQVGSTAADVVRYIRTITDDGYVNVAHGKDPRCVKKEIIKRCATAPPPPPGEIEILYPSPFFFVRHHP